MNREAALLFQQKDYTGARLLLEQHQDRGGLPLEDASLLAACYLNLGRPDLAEHLYRNITDRHPGSARDLYNLALALERQGRTGEAAEALRQALRADPGLHVAARKLDLLTGRTSQGTLPPPSGSTPHPSDRYAGQPTVPLPRAADPRGPVPRGTPPGARPPGRSQSARGPGRSGNRNGSTARQVVAVIVVLAVVLLFLYVVFFLIPELVGTIGFSPPVDVPSPPPGDNPPPGGGNHE